MTSKNPFRYQDLVIVRKDLPDSDITKSLEAFDMGSDTDDFSMFSPGIVLFARNRNRVYDPEVGLETIVLPLSELERFVLPSKPPTFNQVNNMDAFNYAWWVPHSILTLMYTNTF